MPGVISDKERGEVDMLIRAVIEKMEKENIVRGKFYQFDKEKKELKGLMKERGISLKGIEEFIFKSGLEDGIITCYHRLERKSFYFRWGQRDIYYNQRNRSSFNFFT